MKDKKLIFGIALAFVFLASFSFSYAYFSNSIVNKDVKDQVVETGTLSLRYVDGACNDIEDMPIYDTTIKKKIVIEPNIRS